MFIKTIREISLFKYDFIYFVYEKSTIYILYKKYDTNLLDVSVISFQNEDVNIFFLIKKVNLML